MRGCGRIRNAVQPKRGGFVKRLPEPVMRNWQRRTRRIASHDVVQRVAFTVIPGMSGLVLHRGLPVA